MVCSLYLRLFFKMQLAADLKSNQRINTFSGTTEFDDHMNLKTEKKILPHFNDQTNSQQSLYKAILITDTEVKLFTSKSIASTAW